MKNKRFINWKSPIIKDGVLNDYNWLVQNVSKLKLGKYTDIGAFTYMNAKYGINISDYVQIGSHCSLYTLSTIDNKKGPIKLGKNSKIGSHSTIMPNVSIGANTIVGANSLVLESLPDDIIAFGVPAKIYRNI